MQGYIKDAREKAGGRESLDEAINDVPQARRGFIRFVVDSTDDVSFEGFIAAINESEKKIQSGYQEDHELVFIVECLLCSCSLLDT